MLLVAARMALACVSFAVIIYFENCLVVIISFILLDGIGDEFSPGFLGGGDCSHILNEFFIR